SRDAKGLSLLTTEEVINVDFPQNTNYYGITRQIPKTYQSHSVNVKILSVQDAAGSSVPYKTSTDKDNKLVISTGNPAIYLYGSQTIKINYQTSGVISLKSNQDQLLLNVNGRGWNQPFGQVNAFLHIPKSFDASLVSDPSCYVGGPSSNLPNCSI